MAKTNNSNQTESIIVKGARVNNLKNIDFSIPHNKFTVITGLSGSGKSSIAFDTIFAEGQRRYLESMSSFTRQFMGALEKPDVDEIKNLSPTIAIDQLTAHRSSRSTVGTMSDTYDYLRILFANIADVYCPDCNNLAEKNSKKNHNSFSCKKCKKNLVEITISNFSFNSPAGACPKCEGIGRHKVINENSLIPNPNLTIREGAIRIWQRLNINNYWVKQLSKPAFENKICLNTPIKDLSAFQKLNLFQGIENLQFPGLIKILKEKYQETESDYIKKEIEIYMTDKICESCHGARLNKQTLNIKLSNKNILEISNCTIENLPKLLKAIYIKLDETKKQVAQLAFSELEKRLLFLNKVGLGYLSLSRNSQTLSGGEAQRIRLATQLGSGLIGVTYILDEPSIGLHQADHKKMIDSLNDLKKLGNTVIVVEHDEMTIRSADYILDIGPGAGEFGGELIFAGTIEEMEKSQKSITGKYLSGQKKIVSRNKVKIFDKFIIIKGARANNLKNIDVNIPLKSLVSVTGVSGSGKSTLINDILANYLQNKFYRAKVQPLEHDKIEGVENINKVVIVDQSPIGRNSRSNPATYTGVFTLIRELFSNLKESKKAKLKATDFSFNLIGGRCENCKGEGVLKFEMNFLPNVFVTCEKCGGKRFQVKILKIKFKDKNISDVLNMSVNQAISFFIQFDKITSLLRVLQEVGLGYIKLGQPATTLSGGEAQRVKLAGELARSSNGKSLYILDEPTTGLHFDDISRLLEVIDRLVKNNNSVIVIEHNLDVIKNSDWVIELGPKGGNEGGKLIAEGTPAEIKKNSKSITSKYL
ncbi:excinuclease ABC subunit A [Candidatus Berkelbacteria bacterium CG_4_9_14_3_um_filter_33_5]|uniref:UvrABC system protein A n=1 Tax=Candidatus Berkelbacteria bacterium CG_4_10_14_0_2_um_filter_35_9_33_12 TaxID=1974499 RepID=A0A2M7W3L1_9BACT|nr:MAG: excinuclease ABC subunit A [Candidatus Berkelbacteria bacterium CG23_combo_of_CG06-09_8_20_14_all_33_15]PIS08389.1 MAG: excinuclease ABC subunit A [Candidatus Berkelbacteria bacterium CG10_big_fil_rev_8_21_14_0_10_33_10]PJA20100.1 MAG: excinuclease ABC subunit A [Candidatus Berkelbacteria bacterium CG_4_10_14_0_2_um_filter_35_9_33_12]PJB51409.1 MAG: excinuclease ABC subunit A [Candidatus Berkelbacteria bacterium CG_4_9_14_3_um_filter_33_5]